ncbi:MAG TPA: hypothetical protein VFH45_02490 [Acidimicrobiales bacterium]|nr:hypothetical protein [Acidimicrobiales bacterium]
MGDTAAGFRCHSGWTVMVVMAGTGRHPVLVARQRLELTGPGLPRQPYHAVAEQGAPSSVIAEVAAAARRAAAAALASASGLAAVGLVAAQRSLPDDLDAILRSHARLHAAEGRLYEVAVMDAASDLGLAVHLVDPGAIRVGPEVDALRQSAGAPWQKDHKWAACAALGALEMAPGP